LSPTIKEFTLAPVQGKLLPSFSAGSHIVVHLPLGMRTQQNSYSLLGGPDDACWRIAVRLQEESRGGSLHLHEKVREGDRLSVGEPLNLFPLVRMGRKYLLFAGGIGITPILSHAREMGRLGIDFEVHYAVRDIESAVFLDELETIASNRVRVYLDSRGERPDFGLLLGAQALGTHVYICGPGGMIDVCLITARRLGWPESHLHSEKFLAPEQGEEFVVVAARSKKQFTVASDVSLLEAIEQAGLNPKSLCRGGACGQCEAEVLECHGQLDHRDIYLSTIEKASGCKIMPCVSRVKGGTLVLNI